MSLGFRRLTFTSVSPSTRVIFSRALFWNFVYTLGRRSFLVGFSFGASGCTWFTLAFRPCAQLFRVLRTLRLRAYPRRLALSFRELSFGTSSTRSGDVVSLLACRLELRGVRSLRLFLGLVRYWSGPCVSYAYVRIGARLRYLSWSFFL